jgi:WD40 repeat protein
MVRRPRRWIGVGSAIISAVILVVVIAQATSIEDLVATPTTSLPSLSTSSTEDVAATSTSPSTSTSLEVERVSLGELVPGLDGTLHALVGTSMRQLSEVPTDPDLTLLRPESAGLGFATSLAFDASEAFLAFVDQTGDAPGTDVLRVWSETATFSLGDRGVTSFQWHQTEPGRLAAITVDASGQAELETLTFDDQEFESPARSTITTAGLDQAIVGWSSYGFLIGAYHPVSETDFTTLLDQTGSVLWEAQNMTVLDVFADKALVIRSSSESDDIHSVIDPSDPDAATDLDLPSDIGVVTGSAWSNDGQLAVHYPATGRTWNLRIFDATLDIEADITLEGWRVWDLAWSPDSRFLLMPGTDDAGSHVVIFYDTSSRTFSNVDFRDWVQWAEVTR